MKKILAFFLCFVLFLIACKKEKNSIPVISSFNPGKGANGIPVIIKGKGFGTDKNQLTVTFNGAVAVIDSVVEDTAIYVKVPAAATTGKIQITRNDRTVISATDFIILPGTWIRKADIPWDPGVAGGVAFSINGKGYFTTGSNGGPGGDKLFEYNPLTDQWIEKSPCPEGLESAFRMVIGNKAYVGTGQSGTMSGYSSRIYEYDPSTDIWTQKADFAGATKAGGFAVGIGNKGYAGFGNTGWWQYDPATDTWTQKTDIPGGKSWPTGFAVDDKIYMGCGINDNNDWWQYDTTSDTWTRKNDVPSAPIFLADCFVINNQGYIVGGGMECWLYHPETDTWEQMAFYGNRVAGSAFAIGNKGYYMGGNAGGMAYFQKDLWEFTPPQ